MPNQKKRRKRERKKQTKEKKRVFKSNEIIRKKITLLNGERRDGDAKKIIKWSRLSFSGVLGGEGVGFKIMLVLCCDFYKKYK